MDSKTVKLVAVSTAIGFIGDAVIYSLGESKGGRFKLTFPKGKEAVKLLALGVFTGLLVDATVKALENTFSTEEEKKLNALLDRERQKILSGQYAGRIPTQVVWLNPNPSV